MKLKKQLAKNVKDVEEIEEIIGDGNLDQQLDRVLAHLAEVKRLLRLAEHSPDVKNK